jgi:membrane peptidoglycan carboxypeptidase
MAGAVATIGAGGVHCTPIIVDKVVGPNGKELPGQPKTCSQALTADVAAGTANAMIGSMTSGTSASGNPRDGVPIGGKTGTSPTSHQDWIIGTTTKVGTAVWTGNVTGKAPLKSYTNPITKANYYSVSRFQIMKAVMKSANTNPALKGGAFPAASAQMLAGESAKVPVVAGQTVAQAQALLESFNFVFVNGGPTPSNLPSGRVVDTNPAAGTKTAVGSTVTVYTSDGSLATTMPNVVGQSRKDAVDLLTGTAGFAKDNIHTEWVAGDAACTVISSSPAPGAAASKSDQVTLTVSTGKPDGAAAGKDPGGC